MATLTDNLLDAFIEIGTDIKNLVKIPAPTGEGQTLTTKLINGVLTPVWLSASLSFSNLLNCTYANNQLAYTSGQVDGANGYRAILAGNKPFSFNANVNGTSTNMTVIAIGNSTTLSDYTDTSKSNGVLFYMYDGGAGISLTAFINGSPVATQLPIALHDEIKVTLDTTAMTVTLTNITQSKSFTTASCAVLANPSNTFVEVQGTDPLVIKAI